MTPEGRRSSLTVRAGHTDVADEIGPFIETLAAYGRRINESGHSRGQQEIIGEEVAVGPGADGRLVPVGRRLRWKSTSSG